MLIKIVFGLLLCNVVFAADYSYRSYKIYDVNAKDTNEKDLLYRLYESGKYDFLHLPKVMGKSARVMVSPKEQVQFETGLKRYGVNFTVMNEDVGRTIERERQQNNFLRSVSDTPSIIDFSNYHRYDRILKYLDELAELYPHLVTVNTIGKSYEGRDIKSITITNGDGKPGKKVILVDAGMHGRDWIAPATALYTIHQLVENNEKNKRFITNYDWVILPVANPDGYEYTHTTDRMWRKNRKPSSEECIGTDINRNFEYHWGDPGTSDKPCTQNYRGPHAFSEPESQAIQKLMLSLKSRAAGYFSLHAFGRFILYPYGFTSVLPANFDDIEDVANAGIDEVKYQHGAVYSLLFTNAYLFDAIGTSQDYAHRRSGFPLSLSVELPGGGKTGFDPDPSTIKDLVSEAWLLIRGMAREVVDKCVYVNCLRPYSGK